MQITVFFLLTVLFTSQLHSQYVSVSGGTFLMGNSENGAEEDEKPEHEVSLSPFKIGKYEVSVAQYDSCVRSGNCTPAHYDDGKCLVWSGNRFIKVTVPESYRTPDNPVVCVTWYQAVTYCKSKGMKLPSEAQWEYAARAGTSNRYSWGDSSPSSDKCAFSGKLENRGAYNPNNWGLYDMTGNVWEWTMDFYDKQYYSMSQSHDPSGPDAGFYRVIRGGGFYIGPSQLRISNRHWFSPDFAELSIGFRCAR
jgi:formylglycine-generating enzyme required for sulfatase activity